MGTKDELTALICSAYGSPWLDFLNFQSDTVKAEEDDCFEDLLVKVLLNGGKIRARDFYAEDEDEIYGDGEWDYENGCASYTIDLDDIRKGIEAAYNGAFVYHDEEEKRAARKAVEELEDENLDLWDAETLFQIILFGEIIYG